MTRKKFINKVQKLMVAFYKDPDIKWSGSKNLGEALKHFRANAKTFLLNLEVTKKHGTVRL